jgi:hypothetical protein
MIQECTWKGWTFFFFCYFITPTKKAPPPPDLKILSKFNLPIPVKNKQRSVHTWKFVACRMYCYHQQDMFLYHQPWCNASIHYTVSIPDDAKHHSLLWEFQIDSLPICTGHSSLYSFTAYKNLLLTNRTNTLHRLGINFSLQFMKHEW